jgi:hypothetical protein
VPGVPAPRPNPSEAQRRHSIRLRRAAWRGSRKRPLGNPVAFYLDASFARRRLMAAPGLFEKITDRGSVSSDVARASLGEVGRDNRRS